ncbi:hypothetical protein ASG92_12845 [Arthrobacter sp. Soil736]|uniref:hypothetical protein n=1 Tax=Arthrobacter sp. Soil736 TaxID=1736395 RepID=UPI0006F8DCC3|nr:hypothetical protein [Arthrobacter sp. Soil736]KRE44550.1 hypothetical protein ASG92_12845 [Arthrobacter sp. Soil736]
MHEGEAVPKIVSKPRLKPAEPAHPSGTLLPGNSETSKLEEQVRAKLKEAGVDLTEERLGIQCGYDQERNKYPVLTPDLMVAGTKVCIEVDPDYIHNDRVAQDRSRNELLAAVGWRVVRLRLGGLEAIGEWDVVSESGTLTMAAVPALVDAIADAVAGHPGVVRTAAKKPAAPRKKPRLGAIRTDGYRPGVHNLTWTLEGGEVLGLAVVDGGRYLARTAGWEFPHFIRHLDLRGTPTSEWRKVLEPLFESMEASQFEPVSAFPWGDSLFIGPAAGTIRLGRKFDPLGPGWSFTANLAGAQEYNSAIIQGPDHTVLAELHAEAIALGWVIDCVELRTGRHGDYQAIELRRLA